MANQPFTDGGARTGGDEKRLPYLILTIGAATVLLVAAARADDGISSYTLASLKERAQPPYCGLYCLYLIMKASNLDPNFADLVQPEYLDAPNGSTLSGLEKAAKDAGLHAMIVSGATCRLLRACPHLAILHVRGGETSRDYDHYVLSVGTHDGWVRICDPPEPVRLVPFGELATRWDGKALIVSDSPVYLAGLIWRERVRLFLMAGVAIFSLLLIHVVQRRAPWPEMWLRSPVKAAVSIVQLGALVVVSLILALVFHSVSDAGFLVYPRGLASTQRAHTADFIARIGVDAAMRLQAEGATFVDARQKRDFEGGHVEAAVNIPVDANDTLRASRIKGIEMHAPIIVYCQSAFCKYADIIASKLCSDGFSDVSILYGGWLEWTGQTQPHKPSESSKSGKWRLNKDGTASPE